MPDFLRRVHGGVSSTPLRVGSNRIKAPQPAVQIDILSMTAVSSTELTAVFSNNRVSGTLAYVFSTSSTASQAECVNEIAVLKGPITVTDGRLTPSTAYYLHWYYTDTRDVKTPTSTTNRSVGTVSTVTLVVAPTTISPTSITISEGQSVSTTFASFTADQPGCTFSEITDTSNKFTVGSTGQLSLSASVAAINSPYSLTVRATNAGGTFDQAVTINATAVVGSTSLAPDSTSTTSAGVRAIVLAWIADWNGTTPAGKTNSDTRVVQLTAPVASLDLTGLNAPAQGVIVRSVGPYGLGTVFPWKATTGCDISGTLTLGSSSNITAYGFACGMIAGGASTNCKFERCAIQGARGADDSVVPTVNGPIVSGLNLTVKDCLFTGFATRGLWFWDSGAPADTQHNFLISGCIFDKLAADAINISGPQTKNGHVIERNWFSDFRLGIGAHADVLQIAAGNNPGLRFWGNVVMQKLGNPSTSTINGGYFISDSGITLNAVCQQNIFNMSGQNAAVVAGAGGTCTDNTFMYRNFGPIGSFQVSGFNPAASSAWTLRDRNFYTSSFNGFYPGMGGPNGVEVIIGNVFNGVTPDFSGVLPYFTGIRTDSDDIQNLKPVSGARTHWNYAGGLGSVGAVVRSEEIWNQKIVPTSVGWPVAPYFYIHFDPTNSIGTDFTTVYDADGNNVPAINPFNFTMVDEEGSGTMATWDSLRVKVNGGPWQTLAGAGLSVISVTPNIGPLIGGANPANTYDYSDKDRDGHGGEIFNPIDTAGGSGSIDDTGNSIKDGYIVNTGGPVPVTPLLPGMPTIPTTQGATPVRAT